MKKVSKNIGTPPTNPYFRTDLACEAGRPETQRTEDVYPLVDGEEVKVLCSTETDGRRYVTLYTPKMTWLSQKAQDELGVLLSRQLLDMARGMLGYEPNKDTRILVAGLGNPDMTPDAIGPLTVRGLTATRHLRYRDSKMYQDLGCCELSAIAPLVLGQTGIESGEIIKGAISHVKPHLVVAIDALAARDCQRLACTVQLSDGGIAPGSGVGNHRMGLDRQTVGVPVLAIGVPTVVDSATLVYDALAQANIKDEDISSDLKKVLTTGRSFVVSPKDCDMITEITCHLLANAINLAFGVGDL